jgi:putative phosphoesterase
MPRGGRRLPSRCVEELERADLILHAGDVVATSVLEELEAFAPVAAVHGNMDQPDVVAALPARRIVEADGARIGMVHDPGPAPGRPARLAAMFPGCQAVVYGHTHLPERERDGEAWLLNPGSPTERRRAPVRSMLVLEVRRGEIAPALVELP